MIDLIYHLLYSTLSTSAANTKKSTEAPQGMVASGLFVLFIFIWFNYTGAVAEPEIFPCDHDSLGWQLVDT